MFLSNVGLLQLGNSLVAHSCLFIHSILVITDSLFFFQPFKIGLLLLALIIYLLLFLLVLLLELLVLALLVRLLLLNVLLLVKGRSLHQVHLH